MKTDIVYTGDALTILKDMEAKSIDCVVTSPPYWALRDYGEHGQIGLEKTAGEFVENLCNIFDEVYRVLKPTGTCFVNLGDTYYGGGRNKGNKNPKVKSKSVRELVNLGDTLPGPKGESKSLAQIPSRFAIAMTDRGWILRNEIIWYKPNAMPSSVCDRFTVDFEKLYFFTKTQKYFFKQQFEPMVPGSDAEYRKLLRVHKSYKTKSPYQQNTPYKHNAARKTSQESANRSKGDPASLERQLQRGRNKRSVWRISTRPYNGAHLAVFPEELVETPIKAGCPRGGIVLDPFAGSGTTLAIAAKLCRHYVGIELNPEYVKLIDERLACVQKPLTFE